MKIKFFEKPPGTEYEAGQVCEFTGWLQLTYANRYINDGYAEEIPEPVADQAAEQPKTQLDLTAPAAKSDKPGKPK